MQLHAVDDKQYLIKSILLVRNVRPHRDLHIELNISISRNRRVLRFRPTTVAMESQKPKNLAASREIARDILLRNSTRARSRDRSLNAH
jgi:hypothetical protein